MSRFAIKRLDQADIVPLGNLIKAEDFHVIAEGREALARIEEQGRLAYKQAVERGRADGVMEGRQAVAKLLAETAAAVQGYWNRSERRLVAIVIDAVRRIIGDLDNTDVVAGMVGRLLGEARDEGKIRLHVSPGQHPEFENRILQIQNQYTDTLSIEVIEDAAIEDDACSIETELGVVETSIGAQIELLRLALEAYFEEQQPIVRA